MAKEQGSIFSSPESFDEYCSRVSAQLRSRLDERVGFFRRGVERLEGLHRAAQVVRDPELEREIGAQLESLRGELSSLEGAKLDGAAP